jgi:CRISPR/Cas system CSM-associated protein Csm3 (group 7 of RAMP superfamily)
MHFEIIGEIEEIETIAVGGRIRDIMRLSKQYGVGRWRKLKGIGKIRLHGGGICKAELHWYEAHGIGKKKMKIKRLLD